MASFGLIAGNGIFPLEVARGARRRGMRVIAIAHLNETEQELADNVDEITWIKLGEAEKILGTFRDGEVSEAAMAGGLSRARLKDSFAPDALALKIWAQAGRLSDDAVLRGLARELESEGIAVIDPVPAMLPHWLASAGLMAGPEPPADELRGLELAFSVARQLGSFDIGQTVAVKDGVVAAVEAVEGTDAALRRAASLVKKGIVIAKCAKPMQDLRFDRPAIGPQTIELLAELNASMIGIEAGITLILERDRTLALAQERGVAVWGHG
ncbi:MAG TPA: UDP-2,3-diacylglucosamine diphosphatase LpxI [Candidatus Binatus sp.]|nr:UDP-2,3-diacylglucosamine diphosphatase LpxI [Candidatus Binatus sp.]